MLDRFFSIVVVVGSCFSPARHRPEQLYSQEELVRKLIGALHMEILARKEDLVLVKVVIPESSAVQQNVS